MQFLYDVFAAPLPFSGAVVMACLSLALLHYLVVGRVVWHRTWDYLAGVIAVLLPFSWWAVTNGFGVIAGMLWTIFALGGVTVRVCYWVDEFAETRRQADTATQQAQVYLDKVKEGGHHGTA